jgi:actin-like ATPase involved in cell morphogenesis
VYALGVDLGTVYTAAATWRDGHAEIVSLGSRAATIPSVVLRREDASFLTGEAANRRALMEPGRVAREFKRRFGDSTPIMLGGTPHSPEALMGRLLRSVFSEVTAQQGEPPVSLCVCHPANWGPYKTDLLQQAIRMADLNVPVTLAVEPVAAAAYYARQQRVDDGALVAVYDLGGGTFDAAVVRKAGDSFEIIGRPEGIEHLGGADFDAAVFEHVRSVVGDPLTNLDDALPTTVAAVARLREECTSAKETLSSDTDTTIPVLLPGCATEVRITRAELERMVRPSLYDTISALQRAIRSASVTARELHSVLLIGGSSRMPLVAQLVGAEVDRPVAVDAHPKHAVALGAAWIAAADDAGAAPAPPPVSARAAAAAAGPGLDAPTRAAGVAGVAGTAGAGSSGNALAGPPRPAAGIALERGLDPGAPPPGQGVPNHLDDWRQGTPGHGPGPAPAGAGAAAAGTASPAANWPPPQLYGPAGPYSGSGSGESNGAPGESNGAPGQTNGAPGQTNGAPGQTNGAPGQTNGAPGQSNGAPGQSNGAPGQSAAAMPPPPPGGWQPGRAHPFAAAPEPARPSFWSRPWAVAIAAMAVVVLVVGPAAYIVGRSLGRSAAAAGPTGAPTPGGTSSPHASASGAKSAPPPASTSADADPLYSCPTDASAAVWACLTSAKVKDGGLLISYQTNFTLSPVQDAAHYHFHMYLANPGANGTTDPADSIMQHVPNPGSWYIIYDGTINYITDTTERGGQKLPLDLTKYKLFCVRIASGLHGLASDKAGGYHTGNCVKITT